MIRSVRTENGVVEYELTRKRVKNINLRVKTDGKVAVSAPRNVSVARIDAFVAGNAAFIFSAIVNVARRYPKEAAAYDDGATIYLWGKTYRLSVVQKKANVTVNGDEIVLALPDPQDAAARQKRMRAFYRAECEKRIPNLCRKAMNLFGRTEMPQISYRRMTSRWGSCNAKANRLTFNTALATIDPRAARYVVFHEFSHFLRQDHSPVFYQELEKRLPEWRQFREILKQEGRFI